MARNLANISLLGSEDVKAQFRKAVGMVNGERAQDAILPAAQLVRDIAKRLVRRTAGSRPHGAQSNYYDHLQDAIFADKGKIYKGIMASLAASVTGGYGPSVIAGVDIAKSPHAHLVEFGHKIITHSGEYTGKSVEGHPYLRPAADVARPLVRQIIFDGLARLLAPFSK